MIKGVIFDIDGVILDSMSIWNDLGARYLKSIGKKPEKGLNNILFSMSMEQGADYLKDRYDIDKPTVDILDGISLMLQNYYFDEVLAKPGVVELLGFLKGKGIQITAATSSPRIHVETALDRNNILSFFDSIYTTGEIGISKHEPDIYNKAAECMKLNTGEVIVVEDSLYALKTAKKAGYISVGVYDRDGETDQRGVEEVSDLYAMEIKDIISNWDNLNEGR